MFGTTQIQLTALINPIIWTWFTWSKLLKGLAKIWVLFCSFYLILTRWIVNQIIKINIIKSFLRYSVRQTSCICFYRAYMCVDRNPFPFCLPCKSVFIKWKINYLPFSSIKHHMTYFCCWWPSTSLPCAAAITYFCLQMLNILIRITYFLHGGLKQNDTFPLV